MNDSFLFHTALAGASTASAVLFYATGSDVIIGGCRFIGEPMDKADGGMPPSAKN